MSESLLVFALGIRVRIDLDGLAEADAATVREAWQDALADDGPFVEGPDAASPVISAAQVSGTGAAMLETLSQRVTLAAIEARRGELWMLHAAGVAASDGSVVALVGPSGRGKTTAARVLGASYGYVSDETVAIDDDGLVWPYRKPLSVMEVPGVPKAQRSPSELGLHALPGMSLRLAAIVLLDRRDDASAEAALETVDLGDALEGLVAESSYLTAMPAPLQTMATLAASVGGIRRVTYREASSLRDVVAGILAEPRRAASAPADEPSAPRPPIEPALTGPPIEPTPAHPPIDRSETSGHCFSRAPYVDALALDDPDRVVLLRAGDGGTGIANVLAGVAPAIWRAADAASLTVLTDAALTAYGQPDGDAEALVAEAVDELVSAGLLEVGRGWRIRDDVAWVDGDERVAALALEGSGASPLVLEGSAAIIWRALAAESPTSAERLIERVAAQVGVRASDVDADVRGFLASLAAASLIEDG